MAVVINGTTGITNPNGSAGAPAFTGQGSNTGLYFPSNTSAGIATAGLGRLVVDANGYVTTPYQSAFFAQGAYSAWVQYGSSGVTYIPTNSTGAPVGTVSGSNAGFNMSASGGLKFNTGSSYNAATGIFTAPVAGKYFFFAQGLFRRASTTNTDYGQLLLFVNGTQYFAGWDQQPYLYTGSNGMEFVMHYSCLVDLAANDAVAARFQGNGAIETYADRFVFAGYLVA